MACKQFSGSQGLDGFAQAHVIAQQRAPGAGGKQRTFGLIGVELDLQQLVQRAVFGPQRVGQ